MEQRIEREWKSIKCPGRGEKTAIMVEWDIVSQKGRILKRSLRQIDCQHSQLTELGGKDCTWGCAAVIEKKGK